MVLVVYFRNFYSRSLVLFPCSISHYHCTRLASTLTLLPLLAIMGNGLVVQVPTSDYAVDLAKPTDGSDIRTISSTTERLATAKMEALRYRKEMYKLVTEEKEGDEGPTTLFYGGGPTIRDLCPDDADENVVLENCIHYISHVRQLLHLQVRRRRRLSLRGKALLRFASGDLVDDTSDDESNDEDEL